MYDQSFNGGRIPRPVKFLFFLALAVLGLFLLGNIIMYLWNGILSEATGVKPLNFWESLGLLALSRILVGGWRFGGSRGHWKHSQRGQWKEKWMQMSEEERAAFRDKWQERCGKK
ncbi:MAG: hypothetical protein IPJ00_19800 [Saprospirales bacterium]|nr:hypothetical protein [Saprospirales bacterium]